MLGHVDGVARVLERTPEGDSTGLAFEAPAELARFIAPKGSVALDGVSLTVNEVSGRRSGVNITPIPQEKAPVGTLKVGERVNLEIAVIARSIARILGRTLT